MTYLVPLTESIENGPRNRLPDLLVNAIFNLTVWIRLSKPSTKRTFAHTINLASASCGPERRGHASHVKSNIMKIVHQVYLTAALDWVHETNTGLVLVKQAPDRFSEEDV